MCDVPGGPVGAVVRVCVNESLFRLWSAAVGHFAEWTIASIIFAVDTMLAAPAAADEIYAIEVGGVGCVNLVEYALGAERRCVCAISCRCSTLSVTGAMPVNGNRILTDHRCLAYRRHTPSTLRLTHIFMLEMPHIMTSDGV